MRIFRNPELKGILALIVVALVLVAVYLALTGTLTRWTGIRLTLKEPLHDAIVFVSDRAGHPDIWVIEPDGSGLKQLTNDAYRESEPVVSPDGYTIVFISKRDTAHPQLYAMDVDGTHVRRLTDATGTKSSPRFSRDGRRVLFLCGGDVWEARVDGHRAERILPTHEQSSAALPEGRAPFLWAEESPDGKLIAAVQSVEGSQVALWMKLDDEMPQPIVDESHGGAPLAGEMVCAAWAADGQRLAATLTGDEEHGILVVVDFESESVRPLVGAGAMMSPAWSPDGSEIAIEALARDDNGVGYSSMGLLVADVYTGQMRPIAGEGARRPLWSGDGKKLLFTRGKDIHVVDTESGKGANLTEGEGSNYDPSWAPPGKD